MVVLTGGKQGPHSVTVGPHHPKVIRGEYLNVTPAHPQWREGGERGGTHPVNQPGLVRLCGPAERALYAFVPPGTVALAYGLIDVRLPPLVFMPELAQLV